MIEKTNGQIAYEAYCDATGGKSLVSGAALPSWDALDAAIRNAWERAGIAVTHANLDQLREHLTPAETDGVSRDPDVEVVQE